MIQPAKLLRTALVTAVLSTVCVVSASAASVGVGTVNTDALRLRDEASTSATVLGTASKGDTVVVLEDAGNGWYKVDYKSVAGYMSGEYLNVSAKADVTMGTGLVQSQGSPLNVRSGPGTSYGKVTSLNNGAVFNIVCIDNGWYKISTNGVTGYVSSDYMVTCKDSAGSRGDGATAVATASSSSLGQQVVDYAKQYLGLNDEEGYVNGIIRGGMSSVADLFVAQMQDWLALGGESRMNVPGVLGHGNWCWRMLPGALTDELADHIAAMTAMYSR